MPHKGSVTAASSCSSKGTVKPCAAGGNKRHGKGDSRMNTAVTLKMDNNDVSLVEALQDGGFNFEGLNEKDRPHHEVFDQDGVSLAQRKNQLMRRVRLGKKKKKEDEAEERGGD